MDKQEICHSCEENEAESYCEHCGEPVCNDCCVAMTIHNQIDYPLCLDCEEKREAEREKERCEERKYEEKMATKKAAIAAKRKEAYWKPEAIAKRLEKKKEKQRQKIEEHNKRARQTLDIINAVFRGQ